MGGPGAVPEPCFCWGQTYRKTLYLMGEVWVNLGKPVDFPFNQSGDDFILYVFPVNSVKIIEDPGWKDVEDLSPAQIQLGFYHLDGT